MPLPRPSHPCPCLRRAGSSPPATSFAKKRRHHRQAPGGSPWQPEPRGGSLIHGGRERQCRPVAWAAAQTRPGDPCPCSCRLRCRGSEGGRPGRSTRRAPPSPRRWAPPPSSARPRPATPRPANPGRQRATPARRPARPSHPCPCSVHLIPDPQISADGNPTKTDLNIDGNASKTI